MIEPDICMASIMRAEPFGVVAVMPPIDMCDIVSQLTKILAAMETSVINHVELSSGILVQSSNGMSVIEVPRPTDPGRWSFYLNRTSRYADKLPPLDEKYRTIHI